jgi:16S rRNA C1402 (ribose-2'-O) methylase RsmI
MLSRALAAAGAAAQEYVFAGYCSGTQEERFRVHACMTHHERRRAGFRCAVRARAVLTRRARAGAQG